ncbi:MAG: hypothetical protein ACRECT_04045 [Thermoplasmata archaeon]
MRPPRRRPFPRKLGVHVALLAVVVALLAAGPGAAFASPSARSSTMTVQSAPSASGTTATVTWDGSDIANAANSSSAFPISFNGVVNVLYVWSSSHLLTPTLINDARLQIFYFGFALATRDVTQSVGSASGRIVMNWTTGPLEYITEGRFLLTASLLSPNGTTAWSQSFWVDVSAAFYVVAALPIVLILIAIYELYGVAMVGRQAALKRKKGGPPTATPPTSSAPPSAPATPEAEATPPTDPPSGGSP